MVENLPGVIYECMYVKESKVRFWIVVVGSNSIVVETETKDDWWRETKQASSKQASKQAKASKQASKLLKNIHKEWHKRGKHVLIDKMYFVNVQQEEGEFVFLF